MKFVFDSDHATFLMVRSGPEFLALSARIAQHPATAFGLSVVTFHEQFLGVQNRVNRARSTAEAIAAYRMMAELFGIYARWPLLPFDAGAGAVFDQLVRKRLRVPTMDLRIAAIALSRGLTLLTRNAADFAKVPGLLVEDWTT